MIIKKEIYDFNDFDFWSGAKSTAQTIQDAGRDEEFLQAICDIYPDGLTDTALNDLLWFDPEWCLELVGLSEEEEEEED